MAEAKQQADWLRVGVATAWAANVSGNLSKPVTPAKIIPPQFLPPPEPPPKLTPEELAAESKRAWALMDTAFSRG